MQNRKEKVPNAPCGVERRDALPVFLLTAIVPNAPCGVESPSTIENAVLILTFLMHRVELKGGLGVNSGIEVG